MRFFFRFFFFFSRRFLVNRWIEKVYCVYYIHLGSLIELSRIYEEELNYIRLRLKMDIDLFNAWWGSCQQENLWGFLNNIPLFSLFSILFYIWKCKTTGNMNIVCWIGDIKVHMIHMMRVYKFYRSLIFSTKAYRGVTHHILKNSTQ